MLDLPHVGLKKNSGNLTQWKLPTCGKHNHKKIPKMLKPPLNWDGLLLLNQDSLVNFTRSFSIFDTNHIRNILKSPIFQIFHNESQIVITISIMNVNESPKSHANESNSPVVLGSRPTPSCRSMDLAQSMMPP